MKSITKIIIFVAAALLGFVGLYFWHKSDYKIDIKLPEWATKEVVKAPDALAPKPATKPDYPVPGSGSPVHIDLQGFSKFAAHYSEFRMPHGNRFVYLCKNYDCSEVERFMVTGEMIANLIAMFSRVNDPQAERDAILKGLNYLWDKVSTRASEGGDTINANSFLIIMARNGLLKFHNIEAPRWELDAIKANAAPIISQIDNKARFAVEPRLGVIPFDQWRKG
jgi:hypothetical protein